MFVEKTDVGVDGVEGFEVSLVETARRAAQERHEEEQTKDARDDAVLVAIGEEGDGGHEDRDVAGKETPQPRVHHVEMRDDESDEGRAP